MVWLIFPVVGFWCRPLWQYVSGLLSSLKRPSEEGEGASERAVFPWQLRRSFHGRKQELYPSWGIICPKSGGKPLFKGSDIPVSFWYCLTTGTRVAPKKPNPNQLATPLSLPEAQSCSFRVLFQGDSSNDGFLGGFYDRIWNPTLGGPF